jgi:hypothetical protein
MIKDFKVGFIALFLMAIFIFVVLPEGFRQYPEGKKITVTFEHELGFERDTVLATHWHRVDGGWYVITKDGSEIWCDNVREVK